MSFATYYIMGLAETFGRENLVYSTKPFRAFKWTPDYYDRFMIYEIDDKYHVVIDYHDGRTIIPAAYQWADVYAKINLSFDVELSKYDKLINISPGFGLKLGTDVGVLWKCFCDFFLVGCKPVKGLYNHLYDSWIMLHRTVLKDYLSPAYSLAGDGYVFHSSTVWRHPNCMTGTNPFRAAFIRSCKNNPHIHFEGGLVLRGEAPSGLEDVVTSRRYALKEYLEKTKQSLFVFNTPAVLNCHGWKLGEYLAMGKAIISTPFSNRLPFPMIDGENVLIVHNQQEIGQAVERLVEDAGLRHKLEKSSREIFEKYCSPLQVIKAIDSKLQISK